MGLFSRRSWDPKDIPNLTFREEESGTDIGFLDGEEHRQAFASIFEKMLIDNRDALADHVIIGLDGKRPVGLTDSGIPLPMTVGQLAHSARGLALALYDSHNEQVEIRLSGPRGNSDLRVKFDNPAFWFRSTAA